MSSKYVIVKTSNGNTGYTVDECKGNYSVGRGHRGFIASPTRIGQARSLEDAVSLCKVDASSRGSVRTVEITRA